MSMVGMKITSLIWGLLSMYIFVFGCAIAVTVMWGTYFHMGAYKCEMNAYIHGCLFSMGAHYSDFRLLSSFLCRKVL